MEFRKTDINIYRRNEIIKLIMTKLENLSIIIN
jgi:hypothetical protein